MHGRSAKGVLAHEGGFTLSVFVEIRSIVSALSV